MLIINCKLQILNVISLEYNVWVFWISSSNFYIALIGMLYSKYIIFSTWKNFEVETKLY